MHNAIKKNFEHYGMSSDYWYRVTEGNGLLLSWFIEWINKDWHKIPDANILEYFTRKYNQTAGGSPYPMGGKVSLDGQYISKHTEDDDLEPYFLIDMPEGVGYIYPYAFVALPKKSGGHHIVRMD